MAANPASHITPGALRYACQYPVGYVLSNLLSSTIFDDSKPTFPEPVVQCVQIKPLPPQQNNTARFRAVFSDTTNYVQTMLATRK